MKLKEKNILLKKSNGITLIALVVTIIVLIILAGISINLILGDNGIITKAQEAKKAQEKAEIIESLQLEIAAKEAEKLQNTNGLTQSEIEEILKAKCGEESVIKNADGTIKSVKPEGKDYEILFDAIYSGTLEGAENPEVPEGPEILLSSLEVGDYIKYNTGVTTVGENGVIMCRVLYNDEEHGLQIISDKNVIAELELGAEDWETAKAAYNSAIEDLNDEAENYLNTTYAVDARCVGSLPTIDEDGNFTEKDEGTQTTVSIPSNWTLPTGWTTTDTGCYGIDENYKTDETAMKAANIWITGEDYWLASRSFEQLSFMGNTEYDFCMCANGVDGSFIDSTLCYIVSDGETGGIQQKEGFRPCFSLRSDIKVTGEDGKSESTAYTIYK